MTKTVFRIILIILLGFTFFMIFQFSSENSEKSGYRSGSVMRKIIDIFPYTKNLNEQEKQEIVKRAQPIIRKLAHFSIYTVVGILMMSLVSTYNICLWKKMSISISVGLVYAISDEIHQSFVPGRSAEIRDVLIDTSGVCMGIVLVMLAILIFRSIWKEKPKKI